MKTIRIATRKSPLALWQADWVKSKLEDASLQAELVSIETRGDQILDKEIAKIGSKGVFTEELEQMLIDGEVDIAVHSGKDMPAELPEGFDILSLGERHEANDVLVAMRQVDIKTNLKIGTSSTRRVAQLAKFYPQFETESIRGNLQTRVEKLKDGQYDALILAKAGIERMGFEALIKHEFSLKELTPAAGQGIIAIEAFESIHPTIRKLIKVVTNSDCSWRQIHAERAFLRSFGGGCSIPVFAHATLDSENLNLTAGISSLDGSEYLIRSKKGNNPEVLGSEIAEQILSAGGDKILRDIKAQLGYL